MYQRVFYQTITAAIVIMASLNFSAASGIEGFIVEGDDASIKMYPHSVFLYILQTSESFVVCGGSILNQYIALTAAHCFKNIKVSGSEVYMTYGGEVVEYAPYMSKIVKYTVHEYYNEMTVTNDIALVRSELEITLGPTSMRVSIMRNPPEDKLAHVAGWGVLNIPATGLAKILQHTAQEIRSTSDCKAGLGSLPPGTFCASPAKGRPAFGDSGSALVIQNYIQIGIVSYKVSNCDMCVYTNVSYFYDWIKTNAERTYCLTS